MNKLIVTRWNSRVLTALVSEKATPARRKIFCPQIALFLHFCAPFLRIIIQITTGAPNTAVTELMESSVGANIVRAIRSLNRQNTAPLPGRLRTG